MLYNSLLSASGCKTCVCGWVCLCVWVCSQLEVQHWREKYLKINKIHTSQKRAYSCFLQDTCVNLQQERNPTLWGELTDSSRSRGCRCLLYNMNMFPQFMLTFGNVVALNKTLITAKMFLSPSPQTWCRGEVHTVVNWGIILWSCFSWNLLTWLAPEDWTQHSSAGCCSSSSPANCGHSLTWAPQSSHRLQLFTR